MSARDSVVPGITEGAGTGVGCMDCGDAGGFGTSRLAALNSGAVAFAAGVSTRINPAAVTPSQRIRVLGVRMRRSCPVDGAMRSVSSDGGVAVSRQPSPGQV